MDNKACLEVLPNTNHHGSECVHMLNSCRTILNSEEWGVHLAHYYREGNKIADSLANMGVIRGVVYLSPLLHKKK